jgi:hypothetical protein
MYKNRIIVGSTFLAGIILIAKFLFDLAEKPTHPFILVTLLAVAFGFGNIKRSIEPNTQLAPEHGSLVLVRLFRIALISLIVCLSANAVYPATGVLSTILIWVIGHSAFAIMGASYVSLAIISRMAK